MKTIYNFGCYKSEFDNRDILMKTFLKEKPLPTEYDLTQKMTRVRSQGKEGACVGFALATGVMEYLNNVIDYPKYKELIPLSPRCIYEQAKKISGHSEGTTLKAAVKAAQKFGTPTEGYWPYEANRVGKPKAGACKIAEKFRIKTYARITNLKQLKQSLVQYGPLLIGVNVYKGMLSKEARLTGVVPNPGCFQRSKDGHALCEVAFNDNSPYYKNDGHIKCKNSWGEKFGDNGYIYLSYKYMKNLLDAFSIVDVDDPKPYRVRDMSQEEWRTAWI